MQVLFSWFHFNVTCKIYTSVQIAYQEVLGLAICDSAEKWKQSARLVSKVGAAETSD